MKSAVLTPTVELSSSLDGGSAFHLKLNTRRPPPQEGCTLFLRYLFPPELYVDPYELEDQLGHPFWLNDTVNLEVPVGTESTRNWVQLQVAVDDGEDVSVPVHARYGVPLDQNHGRVALPQPFGIWSFKAHHWPDIQHHTFPPHHRILTLTLPPNPSRHTLPPKPGRAGHRSRGNGDLRLFTVRVLYYDTKAVCQNAFIEKQLN
ncbi:hypothetical protein EUX98_g2817 [Antrodiella citrinella]|uniref:Protein PBN1 n=1 Tax=Antrodiella citrinella TaxID=2447956 RepID=A0A4S4N0W0_9APHY|nr:hypothetical protein EUX98_g2817 [Antrodiella citrinella]